MENLAIYLLQTWLHLCTTPCPFLDKKLFTTSFSILYFSINTFHKQYYGIYGHRVNKDQKNYPNNIFMVISKYPGEPYFCYLKIKTIFYLNKFLATIKSYFSSDSLEVDFGGGNVMFTLSLTRALSLFLLIQKQI